MENELIQLRQAKSELQAQVSLQNRLIEQQQEHIGLLEKQNQLQEQQIAALTGEVKARQGRLGKNSHSTYQTSSPRQLLIRRFPSSSVAINLILLVFCLLSAGSIGIYSVATSHLSKQRDTSHGASLSLSPSTTAQVKVTTFPGVSPGPVQVTIPGLFTISTYGTSPYFEGPDDYCHGTALATDRLTYTNAELQEMYNYFKDNGQNVLLPKTLKVIDGGSTTTSQDPLLPQFQNCPTGWEMTNIGQKPIQLVQVRMKLLANSTEADALYRLVDFCSVLGLTNSGCPGLGGQSQPASFTFRFGPGKAGSFIQGQSAVGEPAISGGNTLYLDFNFLPASPSVALTFTIEPEFVINTSQENGKVIDLPQWKETFVMAPASHFGCYQLQGSTFGPVNRGAICF